MSALFVPRIHFLGLMGANTPTANNNNYDLVLDPENIDLFEPYKSMSDDGFRQLMRSLILKSLPYNLGTQEVLNANWDYEGDNSMVLSKAAVTTLDDLSGQRLTSSDQDPLIGLPVDMQGDPWGDTPSPPIIVDNDPTGDLTSQIFKAKVQLGDDKLGFLADAQKAGPLPRCYSRWIDLQRNLVETPDACFAAIWQQALPTASLEFFGTDRSPILAHLAEQAQGEAGLVMRFCTYYFERKYTDQQMADFFKNGQRVQNLSQGFCLGTIGVWRSGDLGSVPMGRQLHSSANLKFDNQGTEVDYVLAPAVSAVDETRGVIAVDLITTFPEVTKIGPDNDPRALDKVDLGTATLEVKTSDGQVHAIGTLDYSTATYVDGAGIVELPVDSDQITKINAGRLQVSCAKAPQNPVLQEQLLVAETDDRSVYLTVGESTTIQVKVFERGAAPAAPVVVGVQQYRVKQTLEPPQDGVPGVPLKNNLLAPQKIEPYLQLEPEAASVGEDGILNVKLTGLCPGLGKLRFVPGSDNPPNPDPVMLATWLNLYFCNVRVLPSDDHYDQVPDDQITFEYLYDEVLRYYWRLFPVMDRYMPLNDKQAMSQRAQSILLLIDESQWFSTLFMPITRDMSNGKRRLLRRWCNRVLRGEDT